MCLRGSLRFGGDGDLRPACIERLRDRLDEALRCACDESELYVVPVGADGVVDDGPALNDSVAVGFPWEDHAVGGFPPRHFVDVADGELALAGSEGFEREVAQAGGVGGGKQLEVAI